MAHQRLVQPVDIHLAVLHHIDVSKPGGRPFFGEQGVNGKRILAVVIPAGFPQHRVVFAGKQHGFVDKLAVVQPPIPLIIPVYHSGFVAGIHKIVIEIASGFQRGGVQRSQKLRILFFQHLVVHQLHGKKVAAVL